VWRPRTRGRLGPRGRQGLPNLVASTHAREARREPRPFPGGDRGVHARAGGSS